MTFNLASIAVLAAGVFVVVWHGCCHLVQQDQCYEPWIDYRRNDFEGDG